MLPNGIRAQWSAGKPVINGWLSIACPFTAEIMAAQGYDSITIDLQHGLVGYEVATTMLQAMRASAVTPLVRVPWLDPAAIMKSLDAGAYGVICPMISTREGVDTAAAGSSVIYFSRLIARASQSHLPKLVSMPAYKQLTIRNWNTTTKLLALMAA